MGKSIELDYKPQERQAVLHRTKAKQILYGGAAGGGKSHSIRWDAIGFCLQNPGLEAFLFRRTLRELEGTHVRPIQREIPPELGTYKENKKRFEFTNGSGLNFCYCEHDGDVTTYLSEEMHWLGIDEAGQFTPSQIAFLKTRLRLGGYTPVQTEFLPRCVLTSNPGGPSHGFLKENFIDAGPAETLFYDKTMIDPNVPGDPGWPSIYIPARMSDNKYLDAGYGGSFGGLPEEMQRAYREGDWDVVVGAALQSLSRDKHCLRPFTPPKHWTRIMSMDWGTARPFSVGWYTVSEGAILEAKDGWPERYLPSGALIRYAEFYGWDGKPNHGCRLESHIVARKILEHEGERVETIDYRVGDTQMWAQTDGPSVAENMQLKTDGRFVLQQAKKDQRAGYAEVLARLRGEDHPMLFATANCRHFWRTLPGLTLNEIDMDKGPADHQEDHVYDEVVYVCRSRPYVTTENDRWEEETRPYRRSIQSADPYATH